MIRSFAVTIYLDSTMLINFLFYYTNLYTYNSVTANIKLRSCDMFLEFQTVDAEILPFLVPLCGAVYYFVQGGSKFSI